MDLLEVADERPRDDAVGLADAFDHEDHAEIEHQVAGAPRVVGRRGDGRRRLSLCSGGQERSWSRPHIDEVIEQDPGTTSAGARLGLGRDGAWSGATPAARKFPVDINRRWSPSFVSDLNGKALRSNGTTKWPASSAALIFSCKRLEIKATELYRCSWRTGRWCRSGLAPALGEFREPRASSFRANA